MAKGFKDRTGSFHPMNKNKSGKSSRGKSIEPKAVLLKDFKVFETFSFPDSGADFERTHVETIEALDFEDAEKKVAELFKIEQSDLEEQGDFGENIVSYSFETIPHDGRTGEKITEEQADRLRDQDEELVSHVIHGVDVELQEEESE